MSSGEMSNVVATCFGENLRRLRKAQGLSQEDAAFFAGLHRTEIGLLERGERVPRLDTVIRLAAALSVSLTDLMEGMVWEVPTRRSGRMKGRARGRR